MKAILSTQTTSANRSARRLSIRSAALWSLQVLLALLFLFTGSTKLLLPLQVQLAQMAIPLPGMLLYFLGIAECAGALGLLLPGLLRIKRGLTPLAAVGLTIITIGATVITILGGEVLSALFPLTTALLCALVAFARRSWM